jgi:hypothetical protein
VLTEFYRYITSLISFRISIFRAKPSTQCGRDQWLHWCQDGSFLLTLGWSRGISGLGCAA